MCAEPGAVLAGRRQMTWLHAALWLAAGRPSLLREVA
jgi:hypothetical protein